MRLFQKSDSTAPSHKGVPTKGRAFIAGKVDRIPGGCRSRTKSTHPLAAKPQLGSSKLLGPTKRGDHSAIARGVDWDGSGLVEICGKLAAQPVEPPAEGVRRAPQMPLNRATSRTPAKFVFRRLCEPRWIASILRFRRIEEFCQCRPR